MVSFSAAIKNAFHFALNPKRFAIYYGYSLAILGILAYILFSVFAGVMGGLTSAGIGNIIGRALGGVVLLFIVGLVGIWINMSMVHNYKNPKSFEASFNATKPVYVRMLGVIVVVAVISSILGMIPILGTILSIVISLIFLYVYPIVVLDHKTLKETLSTSWHSFKTHWLQHLITWVLNVVIGMGVILLFGIPLFASVLSIVLALVTKDVSSLTTALPALAEKGSMLVIGGLVLITGFSISKLFSLGFITDVYGQLKKK